MPIGFPRLQYGLLVGIGGGVPTRTDQGMIRLGHVVARAGHFERKGVLAPPPTILLNAARELAVQRRRMDHDPIWENTQRIQTNRRSLRHFKFPGLANDHLYQPDYRHRQNGLTCEESGCDPKRRIERPMEEDDDPFIAVHRGLIASGELVIKDAQKRDSLAQEHEVLCFEMEAVGALVDFPCMVIRGISDYCDSHKNDVWHCYAAAVAAAYARQLFFHLPIEMPIEEMPSNSEPATTFALPLNLSGIFEAPQFVARKDELKRIEEVFKGTAGRRIAVLHGLGGIGKTQLAIAYTKRYTTNTSKYSATIWFNARDETALKQSFSRVADWIIRHHPSITYMTTALKSRDLDQVVAAVKQWLEEPMNHNWLAVYDNYDNPLLSNNKEERVSHTCADEDSTMAFDLRRYLPETDHGAIIVTTRSSRVKLGQTIKICKLEDMNDSLEILMSVSGRERLKQDPAANDLVKRLDGLPLALATAGAYLEQVSVTCTEYLQLYRDSWQQLHKDTPHLPTYDQTLYSTWNVSYVHIKKQSPVAAILLRQWAYFDHEDLWYELLADCGPYRPEWLGEILKTKLTFHDSLRLLCSHGLVEADQSVVSQQVESRGYSVHGCVHSWMIHVLNEEFDSDMAYTALKCVAAHVPLKDQPKFWLSQRRLIAHTDRCLATIRNIGIGEEIIEDLHSLGILYADQGRIEEAEKIYNRALQGSENARGPEHISTLNIANDLGYLYVDQGRLDKAEAMYDRALQGKEKALGPEDTSTLNTVNNTGLLYASQGRFDEAEVKFNRALQGFQNTWGPAHTLTLHPVNNLGNLYARQGRFSEAEAMYIRALQGYENAWGPEHTSTLNCVNNLGNIYAEQGQLKEAESMYNRALEGYEKAKGLESPLTLYTVNNLANVFINQRRLDKAEAMYNRALQGFENAWGPEHMSTLDTVNNLGKLYSEKGRLSDAEAMYGRALQGYEKALGPGLAATYVPTLNTLENIADVFVKLGKFDEALLYYYRARDGVEIVFGRDSSKYLGLLSRISSAESRYNGLDSSRQESSIRRKLANLWKKARKES
ncbi:TPR-like protein [Aspergillus steynii IBT 23096]|uniref:TPR-like protein n=1 Tax=Aspergillus steynii IBT 23096 TaxID=1392250 RepID=A0A2I2FX71_9EURO|nr:TPR-like protein [Aspergillus steynii IBT 23096]PLB45240.1 TPR-like protein [Aspergillus steynii IBT 23096]